MRGYIIKENLTKENMKILEKFSQMSDEEILMEMKVPPQLHEMIIDAITRKAPIKIWYGDELDYRIIEPYCYGLHKNTKNFVLRAYQVDGYSSSGNKQGWKLFLVDKIRKIEYIENLPTFKIRPEYNPNDKHMLVIITKI